MSLNLIKVPVSNYSSLEKHRINHPNQELASWSNLGISCLVTRLTADVNRLFACCTVISSCQSLDTETVTYESTTCQLPYFFSFY